MRERAVRAAELVHKRDSSRYMAAENLEKRKERQAESRQQYICLFQYFQQNPGICTSQSLSDSR